MTSNARSFIAYYFNGLLRIVDEHHLFIMAGGLAFSLFTCLVPFVLITLAVLGSLVDAAAAAQQLSIFIHALVPYPEQATFIEQVVLSRAREFAFNKGIYGLVGGLILLFTSSGLFSSMRTILNSAYCIEERRGEVVGKIRDFGMVFLILCMFLSSMLVLPIAEALLESTLIEQTKVWHHSIAGYLYGLLSFLGIFATFYALYALVPYGKQGSKTVALSALCAAMLWEIAKQAFGFYITRVASFERLYGTYALVVLPAFWVYYSSVIFIVGAEIGQLYRTRNHAQ